MSNPEIAEHLALRAAYAAQTAAVRTIDRLKLQIPQSEGDVVLRRKDRDALSTRASRGEPVIAADIRTAEEAIRDAEALVVLLSEAVPKAIAEAKNAARVVYEAEGAVRAEHRKPFVARLKIAADKLRDAQRAFDSASIDAKTLPTDAAARLGGLLNHLGRDVEAEARIQEIERRQEVNRMRTGTPLPQLDVI